jgi:hypothetical protein
MLGIDVLPLKREKPILQIPKRDKKMRKFTRILINIFAEKFSF